MNREARFKTIQQIEEIRQSRVIVYVTGDRRGLETRIASDIFPFLFSHLTRVGKQNKIDLFLYSTGGINMAGYGLVQVVKEFCEKFGVIIPFKALSCATLVTLGADEVLMTEMGQLSPIDPSVEHPLGPSAVAPAPQAVYKIVPISVEDVANYLELAKSEVGLKSEEALVRVFERLATDVRPLALGSVHRAREQIRFLARTLLSFHTPDENKIGDIVEILSRARFSHDYLISRREAKDILKLNLIDMGSDLKKAVVALFDCYREILSLDEPYMPEVFLGDADVKVGEFTRAIIESTGLTYIFRTRKEVRRVEVTQPGIPVPVVGYRERVFDERWMEDHQI